MPAAREQEKKLNLLATGLDSGLVERLVRRGHSLASLKAHRGRKLDGFTSEEVQSVRDAVSRRAISQATVRRLVAECDWRCCICFDYDRLNPVVIHHIKEHAKTRDDRYENLALLCPNHHAEAHTHSDIARPPCPPELVAQKKREWIQAVAAFKAGLRCAPGREPVPTEAPPFLAPAPPRLYTDRDRVLVELTAILRRTRSAALHGMGGVGKTSLALRVAKELAGDFPGGVFWADLGEHSGVPGPILRGWSLVLSGIPSDHEEARELAVHARDLLDRRQRLSGPLLVLIDDVRPDWVESAVLLRRTVPDGGSVLLTTRDITLAQALDAEPFPINVMEPDEALGLLQAHTGEAALGASPGVAAELIAKVGHLPLAIELLGRELKRLHGKPGDHLRALSDALDCRPLERLKSRGHPGVAATFAITYEALAPAEQRLFRWLGVCSGAVLRLSTVAAILDDSAATVEPMLDDLVDRALLRWDERPGVYRIHPLLHEYSIMLLSEQESGREEQEARTQHLSVHLEASRRHSSDDPADHDVLEEVLPDLLIATRFANQSENHRAVAELAELLWEESNFLPRRGHYSEGWEIIGMAVAAARALNERERESYFLGWLANACSILGRISEAFEHYKAGISICREIGDKRNEAVHLGNLGLLYDQVGERGRAVQAVHTALRLAEQCEDPSLAGDQLSHLGAMYRYSDPAQARKCYESALEIARLLGERDREGGRLSNLGLLDLDEGDLNAAAERISQGLAISREIGDRRGEANRSGHLGRIYFEHGELAKAAEWYNHAVHLCRQVGDVLLEGSWVIGQGNVLRAARQFSQAIPFFARAADLGRQAGSLDLEGKALVNLGLCHWDLGDLRAAETFLTRAVSLLEPSRSSGPDYAQVRGWLTEVRAMSGIG